MNTRWSPASSAAGRPRAHAAAGYCGAVSPVPPAVRADDPAASIAGGCAARRLALGILKVLGSTLLGGASRNPLLASFAVIIGLLIWFNLVCQVILLTASWIATGMADDGLIADPEIAS